MLAQENRPPLLAATRADPLEPTTEKCLGMQQTLVEAVNDKLGIVDGDEQ